MDYGKIGELSAMDAGQANDAHWKVDQAIRDMLAPLTLAQKEEVKKVVHEYCLKAMEK